MRAPRWRGDAGRLEVWYTTLTQPATGTGVWLHTELVAPTAAPAYVHGWAAVFPLDAEPVWERFGPRPAVDLTPNELHNSEVATAQVRVDRLTRRGWKQERCWRVEKSAHAEIGVRP